MVAYLVGKHLKTRMFSKSSNIRSRQHQSLRIGYQSEVYLPWDAVCIKEKQGLSFWVLFFNYITHLYKVDIILFSFQSIFTKWIWIFNLYRSMWYVENSIVKRDWPVHSIYSTWGPLPSLSLTALFETTVASSFSALLLQVGSVL